MSQWTEEQKDRILGYLKQELDREDQPISDGTEADFRDLLDFACTTTVEPTALHAPTDKPASSSAPKAE